MKFKNIEKNKLVFNTDIPTFDYDWTQPILVSEDMKVYAGNSLRNNLYGEIKCVIIPKDDYLEPALNKIELTIAEEASQDRYTFAEKEIKKYLNFWQPSVETFSLFTDEEIKDTTTIITEQNYKEPSVEHDMSEILNRSK